MVQSLPQEHFHSFTGAFMPHSGQNFVPAGIGFPQLVQKASVACLAPHSGQNFAPAAICAPHALQKRALPSTCLPHWGQVQLLAAAAVAAALAIALEAEAAAWPTF